MPAPPTVIPVAKTGLDNNCDQLPIYNFNPAMLTPFNVVGGWGFQVDPDYPHNGFFANGKGVAPGIGDSIEFRMVMAAGIYTARFWMPGCPDGGQVALQMNDVHLVVGGINTYSAVVAPSNLATAQMVGVADGVQRIKLTVTGKVGGSSNYYAKLLAINFTPYRTSVV